MSDELGEAMFVRNMRRLARGEQLHDPALSAQMLLAEYDTLRRVEQAAAALVEKWKGATMDERTLVCIDAPDVADAIGAVDAALNGAKR